MKVFRNILAVLFSITYFLCLIIVSVLMLVSSFFRPSYYSDILKDINFEDIKLSDLGIDVNGEDVNLKEYLVDLAHEAGIENKLAEALIDNERIKNVVGQFASDFLNYTITKENVPQISKEDIRKILEEKEVKAILEKEISDQEVSQMVDDLNKYLSDMFEKEINNA